MKKTLFIATVVAMSLAVAMPMNAQNRKDKKAAAKAQWEMEQQQQREEAELRHKLRMDSIANAGKVAEEKAAAEAKLRQEEANRAEAERREADAKRRQAEAAAALQEVEYNEPCMGFESTVDMIRGRGNGEDLDHQFSVDLARTAALDNMASQISTKIQGLLTRNRKQGKQGLNRASLQKAEDMVTTEVEQTTGYNVACSKTMTFIENGQRVFKTYMVVEVSTDQLLKPIFNDIQKDGELHLDMNFDEFKKEFDKRFSNE